MYRSQHPHHHRFAVGGSASGSGEEIDSETHGFDAICYETFASVESESGLYLATERDICRATVLGNVRVSGFYFCCYSCYPWACSRWKLTKVM